MSKYNLTTHQAENLERWIRALLSGDYKQGTGQLYNSKADCYCVLGVSLKEFGFVNFGDMFFFDFRADSLAQLGSRLAVPLNWHSKTFGLDHKVSWEVSRANDSGWSFTSLANYLSHFLPDTDKVTELREQIIEKLKVERQVRWEKAAAANKMRQPFGGMDTNEDGLDRQAGDAQ